MTAEAVETITQLVKEVAKDYSDVVGVYLFGSVLSGASDEGSDVDLGVLFSEKVDVDRRVNLQQDFAEALGCEVDLIDLGRAGAFVALEAIRGERVYEQDGLALDEFDLYVLRRAGDLAPFERERRRQILRGS